MGILDSLAQILPYAIPAAAGAALGGPGLGMVGAGAAAQAKSGSLDQQMKLAEMINEGQYRNADLGLRKQEIQSNEQLREMSLQQSAAEHADTLQERYDALAQQKGERDAQMQMIQEHQQQTLALMAQGRQLQAAALAERTDEGREKIQNQYKENVRSRLQGAESLAQQAKKDAEANTSVWTAYLGVGKEKVGDAAYDRAYLQGIRNAGLTRDDLLNAGVSQSIVDKAYPPPKAMKSGATPASATASAAPAIPPGAKPVYDSSGKLIGYRHD